MKLFETRSISVISIVRPRKKPWAHCCCGGYIHISKSLFPLAAPKQNWCPGEKVSGLGKKVLFSLLNFPFDFSCLSATHTKQSQAGGLVRQRMAVVPGQKETTSSWGSSDCASTSSR